MTVELMVALAVLTYASRAAALVLLPPPPPGVAALLDRLPAPLFAGLAALSLIDGDGGLAAAPTLTSGLTG